MSKNKSPLPYIYQKPRRVYEIDLGKHEDWSKLKWISSPEHWHIERQHRIFSAMGLPAKLLEPSGYNCPCHLEFVRPCPEAQPFIGTIEGVTIVSLTLSQRAIMRLSLLLVKGGLTSWKDFLSRYPLALDDPEIRIVYQDYILRQILRSPQRLWAWLRKAMS